MTTTPTAVAAIPFDAELTVIHLVDESTGCPRGIASWVPVNKYAPEGGTVLVVVRCVREPGHPGSCVPPTAKQRRQRAGVRRTRCGLVVGPTWIDYAPDAAAPCRTCHGTGPEADPLF